jgi:transposase-like protein
MYQPECFLDMRILESDPRLEGRQRFRTLQSRFDDPHSFAEHSHIWSRVSLIRSKWSSHYSHQGKSDYDQSAYDSNEHAWRLDPPLKTTELAAPCRNRATTIAGNISTFMKMTKAACRTITAMIIGPRLYGYRWKKKATGKMPGKISLATLERAKTEYSHVTIPHE